MTSPRCSQNLMLCPLVLRVHGACLQVRDAGRVVIAVIVHARTPDAGQGDLPAGPAETPINTVLLTPPVLTASAAEKSSCLSQEIWQLLLKRAPRRLRAARWNGRVQVNAAVDEAAALAEATAKLVATARRDSRAVPVAERKRAQTLLHSVVVRRWLRQ